MRCKNCGWENPAGVSKCEKCNASLSEMAPQAAPREMAPLGGGPRPVAVEPASLKGTLPDSQAFASPTAPTICPKCNYPLGRGTGSCPNCGTTVAEAETPAAASAVPVAVPEAPATPKQAPVAAAPQMAAEKVTTVNPWATPQLQPEITCSLCPLAWDNESSEYAPIPYKGETIQLNRSNTDPNNPTITSQVQAELVYENGQWYITDKSAQQTTYIHVGEKTPLKKGDVILLGNRRFEFND